MLYEAAKNELVNIRSILNVPAGVILGHLIVLLHNENEKKGLGRKNICSHSDN